MSDSNVLRTIFMSFLKRMRSIFMHKADAVDLVRGSFESYASICS